MQLLTALKPLPRSFYARPAEVVAQACLGKLLVHQNGDETLLGRIVESEAYLGVRDRAAHCFGGRRTARNEVMWGPAGHAYVFFIYGMHFHLNLVSAATDTPEAVLIRAVEPLAGLATMQRRRRFPEKPERVANGPGKLCEAFGIAREHNGADLCRPPLFLAEGTAPARVRRCPRIGVDYAGAWAKRRLRFVDADSTYLSVPPPTSRQNRH